MKICVKAYYDIYVIFEMTLDDVLFCTTDGREFSRGKYDLSKNYQSSALLRLRPDVLGLAGWNRYKDMDFKQYKLIWLHLNPQLLFPPWYVFPRLLKKASPDSILLLKHEYWERYYDKPMEHILKRYFNQADYIVTNTKIGRDVVEDNLSPPVLYAHIGQPTIDEMPWSSPLSWDERNGVFVLRHTTRDSMIGKLEIGKRTGLHVHLVDSVPPPYGNIDQLKHLADTIGVKATVYGRLDWSDYINVLRRCRVALDTDYVGVCRMAYEAARVSVPVVGTNLAEYRNILYPTLTYRPTDLSGMSEKIMEIHEGSEPKSLNNYASTLIREYWSHKSCKKRLLKLFEKIGYDYDGGGE